MSAFIEVPASKNSLSKRKPVYGVGINDADYMVFSRVDGSQSVCSYYQSWVNMMVRCYSSKFQEKKPTYTGCSITKEWLTFSNFRAWMITQDWRGKHLDKDILIPGNKEYGQNSCMFVSGEINSLLTDNAASRGDFPQGVSLHRASGEYKANCSVRGKLKNLGLFTTIPAAEHAYLTFKSCLIKQIAFEAEAANNPKLQAALLIHADLFNKRAEVIK